MKLRAQYAYDADEVSRETGLVCDASEDMALQSFKEETDINTIVKRFGLTGEMPQALKLPTVGDFTGVTDYQSAMNLVIAAESGFRELPAELRKRFDYDPGRLLKFLEDPGNAAEAMELGLVRRPPERTRDAVQAIDELAAKLVVPKA